MVATGEFNIGSTLHMKLSWYTFSLLLLYEFDQVKLQWNSCCIRRRHDTIPGRPDSELFFLPELSGGQNQETNSSNLEIDCAYYKEGQTIYTCFGEDKHTIINNECFWFCFIYLHSFY